jgi:hypothetical protein
VFGPADLCFNAVLLLLDVPKIISDFYDATGAVFDKVAPTLSQFKKYSRVTLFDNVDEDLKLAIYKVLINFSMLNVLTSITAVGRTGSRPIQIA